jgi:SAM-dependent methyltransferase
MLVRMTNPWNERYASAEYFYGTEPNDFLRQEAERLKSGSRVLCLAEGEGRNAVYLAGLGHEVTGVDGSSVGLEKLQRLARERGLTVSTVVSDLAEYDLGSAQWDAIVSIWCHLPPPLRADVHRRAVQALKPGGWLILEAYTPRQLEFKTGGPPNPDLMMTLERLKPELGELEWIHAAEIDRVIHEGKGHDGQSAVVQLVARKH